MTAGSIIKSAAGRDKGQLMMVLAVEEPYLILADGHSRRIEKPKRKKIRHVTQTGFEMLVKRDVGSRERSQESAGRLITGDGRTLTNKELRGILSRFAAAEQEE